MNRELELGELRKSAITLYALHQELWQDLNSCSQNFWYKIFPIPFGKYLLKASRLQEILGQVFVLALNSADSKTLNIQQALTVLVKTNGSLVDYIEFLHDKAKSVRSSGSLEEFQALGEKYNQNRTKLDLIFETVIQDARAN